MLCTPSWVPASRLVPGLPLRPWSCTIFPYTTLFRSQYLQKTGVITGFTVTVDPARLGLGASAHVILKLRQHNWRALRQQLQCTPIVLAQFQKDRKSTRLNSSHVANSYADF